jgi:starch phosphorylase
MVKIAPEFTMKRMIDDYCEKYYLKLWKRNKTITDNNFQKARELAAWKMTMIAEWDTIEVLNYDFEKSDDNVYHSGHEYKADIALDVKNIPKEYVGVEFVITHLRKNGVHEFEARKEFDLVSCKSGKCLFRTSVVPEKAGTFFYGVRIYPKNKDLPHRQDFDLLRWID